MWQFDIMMDSIIVGFCNISLDFATSVLILLINLCQCVIMLGAGQNFQSFDRNLSHDKCSCHHEFISDSPSDGDEHYHKFEYLVA